MSQDSFREFYLSVCAIAKNEAPYIEEWIEWHLYHGVEHFFIYENGSTDNTREILNRYAKHGIVTVIYWPETPPQFTAYNNCLTWCKYKNLTTWLAFIDIDEFLQTEFKQQSIPQYLSVIDHDYGDISVLAPHWVFFGDGTCKEPELDKLVIDRFFLRSATADKHVKSIVKPDKIISVGNNPHTFRVKEGTIRNTEGVILPEEYAYDDATTTLSGLRINHYHTKTKEEYYKRKLENNDSGSDRPYDKAKIDEMFKAHNLNEFMDKSASVYAPMINQIIKRMRQCQKQ